MGFSLHESWTASGVGLLPGASPAALWLRNQPLEQLSVADAGGCYPGRQSSLNTLYCTDVSVVHPKRHLPLPYKSKSSQLLDPHLPPSSCTSTVTGGG